MMKLKKKTKRWIIAGIIAVALACFILGVLFYFGKKKKDERNGATEITQMMVDRLEEPIGLDSEAPSFSWVPELSGSGEMQEAYRLRISETEEKLLGGDVLWDSDWVTSSSGTGVEYEGPKLQKRETYYWKVEIRTTKGRELTSNVAHFETGLMDDLMQEAKWISAPVKTRDTLGEEEDYRDDTEFSISYEMTLQGTDLCVVFGADDGVYGTAYLLEVGNYQEITYTKLWTLDHGSVEEVPESMVDVSFVRTDDGHFEVQLQKKENELVVAINQSPVVTYPLPEDSRIGLGDFGFYKSRGTSYAYIDNVKVESASGYSFSQSEFEDINGTKTDELKKGSGFMLLREQSDPAPVFLRKFTLNETPVSARFYVTALGSVQGTINGQKIGDDYFAPGRFQYDKELVYRTYDVTSLLSEGENRLELTLYHGWFDRGTGNPGAFAGWPGEQGIKGELLVKYEDGSEEIIPTDENFLVSYEGPVLCDDMYQGEWISGMATLEEESFLPVRVDAVDPEYRELLLRGNCQEGVKGSRKDFVSVEEPVPGVFVYDFGSEFSGTASLSLLEGAAAEGTDIYFYYAEWLNEDRLLNADGPAGTVWRENLLTAAATDRYTVGKGAANVTFDGVYHGFRYIQVVGMDRALTGEELSAICFTSAGERTASFESSDSLLNDYVASSSRSIESNFLEVPTDCNQRDERLGWAGDAQIISGTAVYDRDAYAFYRSYLRLMRDLQTEAGSFPDLAPYHASEGEGMPATSCWGDAPVIITWNLYKQYGEKQILSENYDSLKRWIDRVEATCVETSYIREWTSFGDHLSNVEDTPRDLTDTAWCSYGALLLSKMAGVLEYAEDEAYYLELSNKYKLAWQAAFIQMPGFTICNTQTSYVLGLAFDLFPEDQVALAEGYLRALFETNGYQIYTGYCGISFLLPVLKEHGMSDIAYSLLLQEEGNSLLAPMKYGATTTWESLKSLVVEGDSYRLDGSLDHYAFASASGFVYTGILGIQSDEEVPGFGHFYLRPSADPALLWAKGSYESPCGTIESGFEWAADGTCTYRFVVPSGSTATLELPAIYATGKINEQTPEKASGVSGLQVLEDKMVCELAPGVYEITQ